MTELETLKSQLAETGERGITLERKGANYGSRLFVAVAKVRELRELLNKAVANLWHERQTLLPARMPTCKDTCVKCEMEHALRSAPPSGPLTNRHGQRVSQACFEGRHAECKDTVFGPNACNCTYRGAHRTDHAYASIDYAYAKTNAGEERKDLAQSSATAGSPRTPDSSQKGAGVVAEQVPAARTDETRPVESAPLGERTVRSGDGNQSPTQKERVGPQDSPICPMCCKPVIEPSRSEAVLIPLTLWTELRKFLNRRMERDRWLKEQGLLMQGLEDCADPERRRAMNFCPMCHETGKDFDRYGQYRRECVCVRPAQEHSDSFVRDLTCAPPSPAREKEKAE